jgi:hypothetical protein
MPNDVKPRKDEAVSDKRRKFRQLAESRTNRAIEAIARVGNLSNHHVYEFDEAEVRKVVRALRDAVSSVESRFTTPRGKTSGTFKL